MEPNQREYDVHFRGEPLVNVVAVSADDAQEQAIDFMAELRGYVPEITAIVRKPLGATYF